MKNILLPVFVCATLILIGCTDKINTSIDETETNITQEIEVSDEEYLINLGKRLKPEMTEQEVIDEIGEPDESFDGGLRWIQYRREDCALRIYLIPVRDRLGIIEVINTKTDNTTVLYRIKNEEEE